MRKTLLLLEQIDTFEQFFASNVPKKFVDVYTPYKTVRSTTLHNIRAISKRFPGHVLQEYWIEEWKDHLEEYETIVVFDNAITPKLLKYIKKNIPRSTQLKLWLWNVPNKKINYLKDNYDVYCFDKEYAISQNISFIEQFYMFDSVQQSVEEEMLDFYFIGMDKGRVTQLEELAGVIEQSQLTYLFEVFSGQKNSKYSGIRYLDASLAYSEIIKKIKHSKIIVEINKKGQVGLTLRALEALFYEKKLLTNNINVKKYDFYHPNNVFILDNATSEELIDFINKPYHILPRSIIEKYSFSNWVHKITK